MLMLVYWMSIRGQGTFMARFSSTGLEWDSKYNLVLPANKYSIELMVSEIISNN